MPEETHINVPNIEEVECERCGDVVAQVTAHDIEDRFGYTDCWLCDSCYESELDEEELESEEEEELEQEFEADDDIGDCPDLTEEEIIGSLQKDVTFGLEFEMFGGTKGNNLTRLVRDSGHSYSGDGSIRGNNAIEVQTKVLKGKSGAKSVLELLKNANDLGYHVNDSCGTHVHLGAIDFFDEFTFKLSDIQSSMHEERLCIERGLLIKLTESFGNEEAVNDWINDMYLRSKNSDGYSSSYRMRDGKISRFSISQIYIRDGNDNYNGISYVCRDSTLDKLDVTTDDLLRGNRALLVSPTKDSKGKSTIYINAENICIYSRPRSEKYHKLKTLFYTYVMFEKFIFSLLPENRRDNNYCNPLSTSYTLRDIQNCGSQEDIEKLWYKKLSLREVASAKREHYEGSRYHAINLHSMFYKHGTVEIRSHHGTLQSNSILMWVALHQKIIKSVLDGKFNFVYNINSRRDLRTVADQYRMFISRLELKDTPLDKFIKHRIGKYSPKTLIEINK